MLEVINDFLSGKVLIVLIVGLGGYFTIRSRFVQLRHFFHMFSVFRDSLKSSAGQLSSFQALMLSLAGRVGAGNIAGVGIAVTLGGPGAVSPELRTECLGRMLAWSRLAGEVCETEFPDYELLSCFSVFKLRAPAPAPSARQEQQLPTTTATEKEQLQRLADAFQVDPADVIEQFEEHRAWRSRRCPMPPQPWPTPGERRCE